MNYARCTVCGNPIDTVTQQISRTGGSLPEGVAHEVCHLRYIAGVRLSKIEELTEKNLQLTERNEEMAELLFNRDYPPGRGLVRRALHWLLWKC